MTDIPKTIIDFESGGSGENGVSWHNGVVSCPYKVARKAELKAIRLAQAGDMDDLAAPHNYEVMLAADKGTVFHKLAELWHTGWTDPEEAIQMPALGAQKAFDKGIKLFRGYKEHFPADAWGEVLGCELVLGADASPEEREAIIRVLGKVIPITIDMVIRLGKEDCERIEELTGLELLPGIYLLDHKTKDRTPKNAREQYYYSTQSVAYQAVYNALKPHGARCMGMIHNLVIGHANMRLRDEGYRKPASFQWYLRPPPTVQELELVGSYFLSATALSHLAFHNLNNCNAFNRTCPFVSECWGGDK